MLADILFRKCTIYEAGSISESVPAHVLCVASYNISQASDEVIRLCFF